MKKIFLLVMMTGLIFCTDKPVSSQYDLIEQAKTTDVSDSTIGVNIDLKYYQLIPKDAISLRINHSIDSTIYSKILTIDTLPCSFKNYYAAVLAEYEEMKKEFPNAATIGYEQFCRGKLPVVRDSVLSVFLSNYVFTGGAHGSEQREYLNFNRHTGRRIDILQTIANKDRFYEIAEAKLRRQLNMTPADKWADFTFIKNFQLPKNIGLTPEGYKLIYNQYELLSYADGHTEILILYKEIYN